MKIFLKKPLVNEKSMLLIKDNLYTFEVDRHANKGQLVRSIKDKFKVDVLSIKTINLPIKTKMQRNRKGYFKTTPFKKAIVLLKKGQKISLFEQASEEVKVTTAESEPVVKEKKSLLKGTKVKISRLSPAEIEKSPSAKASGDKGEK